MTVAAVREVHRSYGAKKVLRGLAFEVAPGEVFGLLGPNGAGKTTIQRMLVGALPPTEGEVRLAGAPLADDPQAAGRAIGYLPEKNPLYLGMTAREQLTLCAQLRGLGKGAAAEVERVAGLVELGALADRLVEHLSRGYRQRVSLALALVGSPRILLLDEPTTGLDPGQVVRFAEMVRALAADGVAVLLSSHRLEVVSRLCSQVVIIAGGRLRRRLEVAPASRPTAMRAVFAGAVPKEFLAGLGPLGVVPGQPSGREVSMTLPEEGDPRPELAALAAQSGSLLSIAPAATALEAAYLATIKAAEREAHGEDGAPAEEVAK